MRLAVVRIRGGMSHDRHLCGDRSDLLPAVRNGERHLGEVRVRVRELACRQTHVGLAVGILALHNIRSRRSGLAAERVVASRVQGGAVGGFVARHRVRLAVVRIRGVVTHDRHLCRDLVHRHIHSQRFGIAGGVLLVARGGEDELVLAGIRHVGREGLGISIVGKAIRHRSRTGQSQCGIFIRENHICNVFAIVDGLLCST